VEFYSVLSGSTKIASRIIMQLISSLLILSRTIQMCFPDASKGKQAFVDGFSN